MAREKERKEAVRAHLDNLARRRKLGMPLSDGLDFSSEDVFDVAEFMIARQLEIDAGERELEERQQKLFR